jgi:hypothetical protein
MENKEIKYKCEVKETCLQLNQLTSYFNHHIENEVVKNQCDGLVEAVKKDITALWEWGHDLRKRLIELENNLVKSKPKIWLDIVIDEELNVTGRGIVLVVRQKNNLSKIGDIKIGDIINGKFILNNIESFHGEKENLGFVVKKLN